MTRQVGSNADAMGPSTKLTVEEGQRAKALHIFLNHASIADHEKEPLLPTHRDIQPVLKKEVAELPPSPDFVLRRDCVAPREGEHHDVKLHPLKRIHSP